MAGIRTRAPVASEKSGKDDDLMEIVDVESVVTESDEIQDSGEQDVPDTAGARLEKTLSARSTQLARTITGRSNAASWQDPGPPPDGGVFAWTQAAMIHLMTCATFGYISSFGVFQTYYTAQLSISPSTVSWIGSLQIFLIFFVGAFSGRLIDAGLFRPVYTLGNIFLLVGVFCTAEVSKLWQIFLAQGICTGLGQGLMFCPAMALLSHYFAKKRSFATGIAALGGCTGGVIFPIVVQQVLPTLGFAWAIRIVGFIMVAISALTIAILKPRLPPRKSGALFEWQAFKEAPYSIYVVGMFFNFWGLYFAFFYVGSFGRNIIGLTYRDSIDVLLAMVSVGFFWRTLPSFYADKTGPLNMLIPFTYVCGIMMFAWIGIDSRASLYGFAAIYGAGSAGIQALFPAALASLTTDISKAGARLGMGFTVVSFACLTGSPIAGALIQANNGDYLYAQIWGGLSFFVGGSLLVAARVAKTGWHLMIRV